jgi:BirA family biotin operon repressor/biotin-[acetyl-CoA-carboxylase] ligase
LSVAVHLKASVGDLLGLPLAVGVCLAQTLESQGARPVALKWPNDLYTRHPGGWTKSGGILTEVRTLSASASVPEQRSTAASLQRVVCGFGLNLFGAIQGLPPSPGQACLPGGRAESGDAPGAVPAGPLYELGARPGLDRRALAHALASAVAGCMQAYPQTGLAAWLAGWQQRDLLAGRRIRVHHADEQVLAARAIGIDAQGALEIEDETGRRRAIASGEVSVRLDPQAGDPHDTAPMIPRPPSTEIGSAQTRHDHTRRR